MSNLLSQLENNEAALLLYLAGELPQEDCIELQRMIEGDQALRAQWIAMDRLVNRTALSFGMDAALADASPPQRARQRLSPVFQQWTARRLTHPATLPQAALRRTPWYLYPLGAAAVILVGLAVFWSNLEPDVSILPPSGELAYKPDWTEPADETSGEADDLDTSRQADALIATFEENRPESDDGSSGLVSAANELTRLQEMDRQMDAVLPTVQ